MIHYISYLKDVLGNNYLGIKFDSSFVSSYLGRLKSFLSEKDYEIYTSNQIKRDGGNFHLTLINVIDYNRLSTSMGMDKFINSLERVFSEPIDDLKFKGIGKASKGDNTSYYIVCSSKKLDIIREVYSLPEFDFHITLGFKWKDVFGVRKNEVLENNSKFLKTLKGEFYKKENFNFVKKISNYDLNPDLEIVPISLTKEYLKVSVGDFIMDIGLLDVEDKLFIFTKYKKTSDVSRLPLTEILRILNQI